MVQYQKKPTKHPKCAATGVVLHGVSVHMGTHAGWAGMERAGGNAACEAANTRAGGPQAGFDSSRQAKRGCASRQRVRVQQPD